MKWPWSKNREITPLEPVSPAWPTLVPPDLEEWFPIARVCAIGGNMYVIAIATCSKCGAAVALYDQDDYTYLYHHAKWHKELWK